MLSDKTLRLVPKAESSPLLLHQVLWTRDIRQQIKAAATGTGAAMKNISQEKIQNLAVSWPVDESTRARVTEQLIETQLRVHKVQERMSQAHSLHFSLINHILRGCA
jgi:type I restriction enzyme S subunit